MKYNFSLANRSTFRIGGYARLALFPKSIEILRNYLEDRAIVIGGGSNVLFPDGKIDTPVIFMDNFNKIEIHGTTLTCGSGVKLPYLAGFCMRNSLSGFENLFGIPGSVGGALYMNAGAFGDEIGRRVTRVITNRNEYTRQECDFSYRHSVFQENNETVVAIQFELSNDNALSIRERMQSCTKKRHESQPTQPSAGSIWKREKDIIPARLIDESGMKGLYVGGAMVSPKHAGFIINTGAAKACDVISLMCEVEKRIFELHGIKLKREIVILQEGL